MGNFTVYHGKFVCHECKTEVRSLRLYPETKTATWMCSAKHMSKVGLIPPKKKKKDFVNE